MAGILGFLLTAPSPAHEVTLTSPHVVVSFRATQDIWPDAWMTAEIKPFAQPILEEDEPKCIATIRKCLEKYPKRLPEANLKKVFVASSLSFYGLEYGGTNSADAVYLTLVSYKKDGFNFAFLERAFHHEFSSILLRNYAGQFPQKRWSEALPISFTYRGDGTQSLREGKASTQYDAELNRQGFLAEYSTSSQEEDFNLYAEAIFSGDADFWKLYDKYPAVSEKADLVIRFYHEIDEVFAKSALRRFAQAQKR